MGARWVPAALAFSAIERVGPRYARLALRVGRPLLPRKVRAFPERVADLLGPPLGPEERDRLVEARLVFLLTRVLLNRLMDMRTSAEIRRRFPPMDLEGAHHLEAALGCGRGAVLISGHFGLPSLIRPLLDALGAVSVAVGGLPGRDVDVATSGNVWVRTRSLQRLRDDLAGNRVCILLADVSSGRCVETDFLEGRLRVSLGAFILARLAHSPLLPIFAVHTGGVRPFRVEISPALPVADPLDPQRPGDPVGEFVRRYESHARRYPSQLLSYEPFF